MAISLEVTVAPGADVFPAIRALLPLSGILVFLALLVGP
jgi:hypothetical protein